MKSSKNKPLEDKVSERISRKKGDVFLRSDFEDLGGYDQVGRALRRLVAKGKLVKIGYGLYARATVGPLSGKVVPSNGLPSLAMEALQRLKSEKLLDVEVVAPTSAQAYNTGRTTQVPTGRVIGVKGRVSRKIAFGGNQIVYERAS